MESKPTNKNLAERCKAYLDKYDQEMIDAFVNYWTKEPDSRGKSRLDKKPHFSLSLRLATWKRLSKPKHDNLHGGIAKTQDGFSY